MLVVGAVPSHHCLLLLNFLPQNSPFASSYLAEVGFKIKFKKNKIKERFL